MDQEEQYQYDLAVQRMQYEQAKAEEQTRLEEEQKQKTSRMGWGIFLFGLSLSAIGDIVDALTVGTLGWLTGLVIDLLLLIFLGVSKGGRKQWKKWAAGLLGETVPIICILPLRTIMVVWSFMASRSNIAEKIGKGLKIADKGLKLASKVPSPVSSELKVASKAVHAAAQFEQ